MIQSKNKKYFTKEELQCKCCGACDLNKEFEEALLSLRLAFGKPMKVNSCYRCEKHNKKVGGAMPTKTSKGSYHLQGLAIDISVPDSEYRKDLVMAALFHNWSVGVYKTFIHLDCRVLDGGKQIMFVK